MRTIKIAGKGRGLGKKARGEAEKKGGARKGLGRKLAKRARKS